MRNVPDDWDCCWATCGRCGARYHESEGGCECEDRAAEECSAWLAHGWRAAEFAARNGRAQDVDDMPDWDDAVDDARRCCEPSAASIMECLAAWDDGWRAWWRRRGEDPE